MLTKTVLCATTDGACKLVDVPFSWKHGEPLPANAIEQRFSSPTDALMELAARGRQQARVHIPKPERKAAEGTTPASPPAAPLPDLPERL